VGILGEWRIDLFDPIALGEHVPVVIGEIVRVNHGEFEAGREIERHFTSCDGLMTGAAGDHRAYQERARVDALVGEFAVQGVPIEAARLRIDVGEGPAGVGVMMSSGRRPRQSMHCNAAERAFCP
jgi:hypothetical protein